MILLCKEKHGGKGVDVQSSSTPIHAWCFSQVQEILIKQGNRKLERFKLIVICA